MASHAPRTVTLSAPTPQVSSWASESPESFPKLISSLSFLKVYFIYLFLAVLGLRCRGGRPLVEASGGYSLGSVHRVGHD